MLKKKSIKAGLLVLTIVFGLKPNGFSTGPCPPPYDCPPSLSTIQETVQFTQDWHFKWDPNNPQEINRNSSVVIKVIGGQAPYNWAVSGAGFRLADGQTQDQSNVLSADVTVCGSAVVAVTDSQYSPPVEGSVRAKDQGKWVEIIPAKCVIPGAPTIVSGFGDLVIRIEGKYQQIQAYTNTYRGGGGFYPSSDYCNEEDCSGLCAAYIGICDPDWGCTECVKDVRVTNECNVRSDWPYCFSCTYNERRSGWGDSVTCRCTVRLQLLEWQCP